ncbi:hypothetical protein [Aeromonas phage L9-6]|nr:hypothetical protein [Aeromonas phage L9-6]
MTHQQELVMQFRPSSTIKIWCEYDISGQFGGNNNEEVVSITFPEHVQENERNGYIEDVVLTYVQKMTYEDADNLEGLYGWEHIDIVNL